MVSSEQVAKWLLQNGYKEGTDNVFLHEKSKFELFSDHLRKYHADKSGSWVLLDVSTYVDLFLEENGEIMNKWHHIVGKNLSTYFQ
jgi:hypothetical protein